jgi:RNA polymerase sigma factor (sigma-70 family)
MAHVQLTGVLRQLRRIIGPRDAAARSDGQLLQRFVAERDDDAFAELVRRHGPMVLGVCRRVLNDDHAADDAFQATFLVLTRKAPALNQWGSLGNWLHTVAYRLALRARAGAARRRAQERQVEDMPDPAADDPAWRELRPLLDTEVNCLPAKYRAPMVLCYLEGRTNEQAAQELGWPAGTVKCRLARARQLLRKRLAGRGALLGGGLLAAALTEQASAAVSATLLETTLRTASLFAAGEATAAGALSARSVLLAEGALQTMFAHKLQTVAAVLLTLGLVGAGAGAWLHSAPAGPVVDDGPPAAAAVEVAAADAPPEKPDAALDPKEKLRPGARQFRRALSQLVTVEAIPANTTLSDALEILGKQLNLTFQIDDNAFAAIGVQKAAETAVTLPKMTNVRLRTVLNKLLGQVKGDTYVGAVLVRPDHIEITTTYHQMLEAGADPYPTEVMERMNSRPAAADEPVVAIELGDWSKRRMTVVVPVDFERQPLRDALHQLAEDTGYDIVIDPAVTERAKEPVTLGLNIVWLDNALNLLTGMAGLDWHWMDRVVYVTTRENARLHREKTKAVTDDLRRWTAKESEDKRGLVTVTCDQKPLAEALAGLAGVQVVYDQRIAKKAQEPVTASLSRVPAGTAVRILADMVDLAVVPMDGAFYVTSKENARALQGQTAK